MSLLLLLLLLRRSVATVRSSLVFTTSLEASGVLELIMEVMFAWLLVRLLAEEQGEEPRLRAVVWGPIKATCPRP